MLELLLPEPLAEPEPEAEPPELPEPERPLLPLDVLAVPAEAAVAPLLP